MRRAKTRVVAGALVAAILAPWTFTFPVQAAQPEPVQLDSAPQATAPSGRPRIGLVLAGGGAKGGAHVGVLKVLEELRVPVDCIAGTSMGALVGAGYASGQPAAQLEEFVTGIDWPAVVGGVGRRDLEPIEQKRAGVTYTNDIEFGLKKKSVVAPSGFVNTNRIDDLLRSYVASARMQPNFDRLPIPFRAVATDMIAGEMVVLDRGDLATAMRASMAIPGVFAPVKLDGRVLADGGMMRNIPVDVARHLCADVVIVVNLVETAVDPEKLNSAVQLMSRSMDVMIVGNENLQLDSLTPQDVRIDVQVGDIGSSDFDQIPVTIPLGVMAARAVAAQLSAYSVSEQEYAGWRKRVTSAQDFQVRIADVKFAELSDVNEEFLRKRLTIRPGDTVDAKAIGRETQRLWALGDFETVGYRLVGEPDHPTLEFVPQEKNWRPDYLRFDIGLYGSEGGDFDGVLYARHNRRWINSLGAQWNNEIQIGGESRLETSFYQPLEINQRVFAEPRLFFERSYEDIYFENQRLAVYRFSESGAGLDFGLNFGSRAQVRLGYVNSDRMISRETGSFIFRQYKERDAGIKAGAIYDSRDTAFSPTRGVAAALEYFHSDQSLGAERDWRRGEIGVGMAMPFRGDVIWMTAAGGTSFGTDLPFDRNFALGGPSSFPGFEVGELRGKDYWTVQASYLWKIAEILAVRGDALYAGFKLQGGHMTSVLPAATDEDLYGVSGYVTGRTPFGPLTVGLGLASHDSWMVWMALGRPIATGTILERGIFR